MDGDVMIVDNPLLCYVSSIEWQSLLGGRQADVVVANDPNKFHATCQSPYAVFTLYRLYNSAFRTGKYAGYAL